MAKPFMIRMHPLVRQQLEALVAEDVTNTMTHEIIEAIKDRLRAKGYWPPPPQAEQSKRGSK